MPRMRVSTRTRRIRIPSIADETPAHTTCSQCGYFTMAKLPAIRADVTRYFGAKPLWLTEYGYQTNPPDRLLGVSYAQQAAYSVRRRCASGQQSGVTVLIHFLVRDEPNLGGWQSGLFTAGGIGQAVLPRVRAAVRAGVARRVAGRRSGARCGPAPARRAYVAAACGRRLVAHRRRRRSDRRGRHVHAHGHASARRAGAPLRARDRVGEPGRSRSPRESGAWTPRFASCTCWRRSSGPAARSRSSSSPCRRSSGWRARRARGRCASSAGAGARSAGARSGSRSSPVRSSPRATRAFDTTSTRFDWVLAVKGALVGLLVAGAYLHDYVLGPGLARADPRRPAAVAAAAC